MTSYGRRNPHCSNCGDLRGGPFGHETSECRLTDGMTDVELSKTMTEDKASEYLDVVITEGLGR
jgi:hypothetical protein